MSGQPFYKHCEFCGHYIQTATSKAKKVCTRYPQYVEHEPDDTCGEWICARCWIPWDMVMQSDQEEDGPIKVSIVDHTKCPRVRLDSVPMDLSSLEERYD